MESHYDAHRPLLSVCIPVYGVEKYIERCARSLFEQTMKDGVEFIFVDDCTPDGSIDILKAVLEEYPNRTNQVRIIRHKQNKGLPQARKTAVEASSGKYILNVDSDDWIENNALESLIAKAHATDADIVLFDFLRVSGNSSTAVEQKVRRPDYLLSEMLKGKTPWMVWNKLFRRSLYFEPNPISFPTSFMSEDLVQTYQLVNRAKSICHLPLPLYNYRRPLASPQNNSDIDTRKIFKQTKNNIELLITAENLDKRQPLVADRMRMIAKFELSSSFSNRSSRKDYIKAYPELNFRILFNPVLPLRNRLHHLSILLGFASMVPLVKTLIGK